MNKIAFLDRDGTLINEPQDTFQVDSLEKLKILPGVIDGLKTLIKKGYKLVMVTNQNGMGTFSFTKESFWEPQNKMMEIFEDNGIRFDEIFICPHIKEQGCCCRKPQTSLVDEYLKKAQIGKESSIVVGDRDTDGEFAKNLGIRFIKVKTNKGFSDYLFNKL